MFIIYLFFNRKYQRHLRPPYRSILCPNMNRERVKLSLGMVSTNYRHSISIYKKCSFHKPLYEMERVLQSPKDSTLTSTHYSQKLPTFKLWPVLLSSDFRFWAQLLAMLPKCVLNKKIKSKREKSLFTLSTNTRSREQVPKLSTMKR